MTAQGIRLDEEAGDDEIHLDTPFLASTLAWQSLPAYHESHAPLPLPPVERRRLIVRTVSVAMTLFALSAIFVAIVLLFALPPMTSEERAAMRIPRSLQQLQQLGEVFSKYNEEHMGAIMFAWVTVFLFIQAFSIPGATYLTILAGALWNVPIALPLVCVSIANGASLCYLLSWYVGGIVRAMPRWQHRIDAWKSITEQYQHNMLSYLTMLRMMPIPPHFLVNIMAPHLGIPLPTFWLSTLGGVCCSTLVYTAVGEELGRLAGPHAFRFFTWRNGMLAVLIFIAATLPGLLKSRIQAPEAHAAPGTIRLQETGRGPDWLRWLPRALHPWIQYIYPTRQIDSHLQRPSMDQETDESTFAWRSVERDVPGLPVHTQEAYRDDEEPEYDQPSQSEQAWLLSYAQRASEFAGQTPSTLRTWWNAVQRRV
ncbi:hypothetical protein MCAP1_001959 [Malassezia caprae]|uniref:VTT domain-containing protein n=1 Tax=Malassezia caprae TaxID=1381934 RepID=A0AAF0E668_9BASI|nr:hypothetical protein MCAP1_001959 [Malassezia caprae]